MIKKIVIAILTIGILTSGIIANKRLRYFEKSSWVFRMDNPPAFIRERFNRGRSNPPVNVQPQPTESTEHRQVAEPTQDSPRNQSNPQRETAVENGTERENRARIAPENSRDANGSNTVIRRERGGHDIRRGSNIRLNNVGTFLASFAFFTLVTIFIDSILKIRKRKRKQITSD